MIMIYNKLHKIYTEVSRLIKGKKYTNFNRDERIWVFGEWFGDRCCDNSLYLANYLVENKYPIKAYFVTKNITDCTLLDPRVIRLEMDSKEAEEIIKIASVGFMTHDYYDFSTTGINYLNGAYIVSLWHGMPWKYIGLDYYSGKSKVKYLFLKFKYSKEQPSAIVSLSEEYKKDYVNAYNMRNVSVINAGYPRNMLYYDRKALDDTKRKLIEMLNVPTDSFVIAYLPTYRGGNVANFSFEQVMSNPLFKQYIEEKRIIILEKCHYAAVSFSKLNRKSTNLIYVNNISAQELMAAADMLITDYSSCFFDYLLLDRPIIHYLYDYDYYKTIDRGLYYKKEDVACGSTPETEDELIMEIKKNFEEPLLYHDLRMKRKEKYMTYEGINSCELIIQNILQELDKRRKQI